jgi:hypothetical protein
MIDEVYFSELQRSLVQPETSWFLSHERIAPPRPHHYAQKQVTEMIIGPWYLDEFGNPTREIKARD